LNKSKKVACAVLAAGFSRRFGSTKQLAVIASKKKTLLQNAIDIANATISEYVYLVLGHDSASILERLKLGRAQVLLNKHYRKGLASSIRTVLSNLPDDCFYLVLMVADQPYLSPRLVNNLIESLKKNRYANVAALAFENEPRNPAIFSRNVFPLLAKLRGDVGARQILLSRKQMKKDEDDIILINVEDERVFFDVDTVANLRKVSKISFNLRQAK
jgi:molybdenum cofactor cytidylyltransferase